MTTIEEDQGVRAQLHLGAQEALAGRQDLEAWAGFQRSRRRNVAKAGRRAALCVVKVAIPRTGAGAVGKYQGLQRKESQARCWEQSDSRPQAGSGKGRDSEWLQHLSKPREEGEEREVQWPGPEGQVGKGGASRMAKTWSLGS